MTSEVALPGRRSKGEVGKPKGDRGLKPLHRKLAGSKRMQGREAALDGAGVASVKRTKSLNTEKAPARPRLSRENPREGHSPCKGPVAELG